MAENGDTSAALRRLEAALNRIAAHVAKPRPLSTHQDAASGPASDELPYEQPLRADIATKIDDLIGGLRTALGTSRSA
jgi:hypothetical protein